MCLEWMSELEDPNLKQPNKEQVWLSHFRSCKWSTVGLSFSGCQNLTFSFAFFPPSPLISVATEPASGRVTSSSASTANPSLLPATWAPPSSGMKHCGRWWGGATRTSSLPLSRRRLSLDPLTLTLRPNAIRAGSTCFSSQLNMNTFEKQRQWPDVCVFKDLHCCLWLLVLLPPCLPPPSYIFTLGQEVLTCQTSNLS